MVDHYKIRQAEFTELSRLIMHLYIDYLGAYYIECDLSGEYDFQINI